MRPEARARHRSGGAGNEELKGEKIPCLKKWGLEKREGRKSRKGWWRSLEVTGVNNAKKGQGEIGETIDGNAVGHWVRK